MEQAEDVTPEPPIGDPDPDQAWKALTLVNDWIKHAESKTGVNAATRPALTGAKSASLSEQLRGPDWIASRSCAAGAIPTGTGSRRGQMA